MSEWIDEVIVTVEASLFGSDTAAVDHVWGQH